MATKKPSPSMEFLVEALKSKKGASYADLKAEADKKGLKIFPIMFGRAQALLGIVKSAKRGHGKAAKAKALKAAGGKKAKGAKRGRPVSGSSKSGKIRELLSSGMTPAEIAKKVSCTVGLVYNVKSKSGGGGGTAKRGPGRPRKTAAVAQVDGSLESIILAVRESSRESERLRRAIEQIRIVLDGVA